MKYIFFFAIFATAALAQNKATSGFAVAPMVFADEGCARDYARAYQFEGVEFRKRIAELNQYGCIDTTATGIFAAIATVRKDLAVEKGKVALFRKVILESDARRSWIAASKPEVMSPPRRSMYAGWIMDSDFYAVSAEEFDRRMANREIPLIVR
jgi:hypothetical protein